MEKLTISDFRKFASAAIDADSSLIQFWRNIDIEAEFRNVSEEDVDLLRELIRRRIYNLNAFEALLRCRPPYAIESLLSRYLGKTVHPDRKFGGYEFELLTMLEDLCEIGGMEMIIKLLQSEEISDERIQDPRVLNSVAQALSMNEEQVAQWISELRN